MSSSLGMSNTNEIFLELFFSSFEFFVEYTEVKSDLSEFFGKANPVYAFGVELSDLEN